MKHVGVGGCGQRQEESVRSGGVVQEEGEGGEGSSVWCPKKNPFLNEEGGKITSFPLVKKTGQQLVPARCHNTPTPPPPPRAPEHARTSELH